MRIILQRLTARGPAMLGYLADAENRHLCVTLERLDTLVTPGTYTAKRDWHHPTDLDHRYRVWEYQNVPGRSDLQIHIANKASQLKGCCAPGESYGTLDGEPAVLRSGDAFKRFMDFTKDAVTLEVEIKDVPRQEEAREAA